MPALSAEQLLIIADVFCREYGVDVVDFAALYAAASITHAQFSGIRVHTQLTSVSTALAGTIIKLEPLSNNNVEFSKYVVAVYEGYVQLLTEVV